MNNISRRVAQLEGSRQGAVTHYAWRPDDLTPDQEAVWLAELRAENGWGEGDSVMLFRWAEAEREAR